MNDKKSFLLYFDSFPMVQGLPMDQRGLLFTALYLYAQRICEEKTATMEQVLAGLCGLTDQTRMACMFMAANILRDTRRWLGQQQSRTQRRQSREQEEDQTGEQTEQQDKTKTQTKGRGKKQKKDQGQSQTQAAAARSRPPMDPLEEAARLRVLVERIRRDNALEEKKGELPEKII